MSHPLYLAFIWHMHQPYYRDMVTGACTMPWVRLHAAKDYVDMLTRLEPFPNIHQTFNMVPSLLDQLEEYLPPHERGDAFLDLSKKPAAQLSEEEQRFVLQWFFMANPERMIKPYPRYHDLLAKRGLRVQESEWPTIQKRFRTQDYLDLQVWFNLAWIDPWLRTQDLQLATLVSKGSHFTEEEKGYVLTMHLQYVAKIIPAYKAAADRGQIELTTSPYYHPILPLLCDTKAALAGLPHAPLPEMPFRHPEDARWQLKEGLARHQQAFGRAALGLWPPEGSVSEEVVKLALESKIHWMATDEEILWRTLNIARAPSVLYRPHALRRKGGQLAMVFRDRELSDLIGFVYSQWDPKIAVEDFLRRLGDIHQQFRSADRPALVSIILDGENAWEFYPNDGHDFLTGLYQALEQDDRFRCVTVTEFLQQCPLEHAESLPELFSGSWIDGNFATWIGHPEKNAAWIRLAAAREALAPLGREDPAHAKAWKSLGAAEGSDWLWWFGATHFSAQADEFDRLFRAHVSNSYRLAGLEPPAALQSPIRRRAAAQALHQPTGLIHPTIDGRETSYYEWLYAGRIDLTQQYAAIQRSGQCLRRLFYGVDQEALYVRLDVDPHLRAQRSAWSIHLEVSGEIEIHVKPDAESIRAEVRSPKRGSTTPAPAVLPCAFHHILELAIPLHFLGLPAGEPLPLAVALKDGGKLVERYPTQGSFSLLASVEELASHAWPI